MALALRAIEEVHATPRRFSRSRTLKRRPDYRDFTADDFRWLYAAWEHGGLRDMLPADTPSDPKGFTETVQRVLEPISAVVLLNAPNPSGPTGVVLAVVEGHRVNIKPTFFPWSTTRNRVEALLKWLHSIRTDYTVYWTVPESERALPERMRQYAVLRRVGTLEHWYTDTTAMMYEGRRFKETNRW